MRIGERRNCSGESLRKGRLIERSIVLPRTLAEITGMYSTEVLEKSVKIFVGRRTGCW